MIAQLIALAALGLIQFAITYYMYTAGWGMSVRSWPALIFSVVATVIVSLAISAVGREK